MSADRPKHARKKALVHKPSPRKRTGKADGPQSDGLWVDKDFFRSLTQRPHQLLFEAPTQPEEDYYLKLADTVVGPGERRKTDRVAFSKTPEESKKPKAG